MANLHRTGRTQLLLFVRVMSVISWLPAAPVTAVPHCGGFFQSPPPWKSSGDDKCHEIPVDGGLGSYMLWGKYELADDSKKNFHNAGVTCSSTSHPNNPAIDAVPSDYLRDETLTCTSRAWYQNEYMGLADKVSKGTAAEYERGAYERVKDKARPEVEPEEWNTLVQVNELVRDFH